MNLVREEQASSQDAIHRSLVTETMPVNALTFGISSGDTIDGAVVRSLGPKSVVDAAIPLLRGRKHVVSSISISLTLPPAIAVRDAYFVARVREMYAAAVLALRPEQADGAPVGTLGCGGAAAGTTGSSSKPEQGEQEGNAEEDTSDKTKAADEAIEEAPGVTIGEQAEPEAKRSRLEDGTAYPVASGGSVTSAAPQHPPWEIADLKSSIKWFMARRLD